MTETDLKAAAYEYARSKFERTGDEVLRQMVAEVFEAGAAWQAEQSVTDADDLRKQIAHAICDADDTGGSNWDEDKDWYYAQAAAALAVIEPRLRAQEN